MRQTHCTGSVRQTVSNSLLRVCGDSRGISRLILIGCLGLAPLSAIASSILDVIPDAYAATPAQGYSGALSQPIRSQQVYPAHEFPSAPVRITSLRWRRYSAQPFENASGEFRFKLSTTSRDEGTLSSTFSENVGSDETVVFDGVWTVSSTTAGDAPHPFELVLQLSTPFVYDPAEGNLLLEHQCFSTTIPTVDAAGDVADGLARAYNLNLDPNASTASVVDTGGEIIQFEYTFVGPSLTQVVPSSFASVESPDFSGSLQQEIRMQQVYPASAFPQSPIRITGLRFRRDSSEPAFANASGTFRFKLSTTAKAEGTLSATFSDNVGADETTVFDGLLTVASPTAGSAPYPFEIHVFFSTPFVFDPSAGNLLIEHQGGEDTTLPYLDSADTVGDGVDRAWSSNMSSLTAGIVGDSGGDIIQFEYTLEGPTLTHVIPAGLEETDGNYYSGTLREAQLRQQIVYGAANFPAGNVTITELRFRRDIGEPPFLNASANVTVKLSTTSRGTGNLSAAFAENSGPDETTVFDGVWNYSSPTTVEAGTVRPFEIILPLSAPFTYNPSAGNLLFDIRVAGGTGGGWTDGASGSGSQVARVLSLNPDAATGNAGELTGDVIQLVYQTTATLEILPNGGTFTNSVQVSLASGVSNSVIRYTTNGDDPTGASTAYTVPFTLTETATVKARLFVNGFPASEIVEATYTRYVPPDIQFNPPGQFFTNQLSVTLVNNVGAGTIRYTVDGAEPTSASTAYSGPLNLTAGAAIRARVFLNTFPISEEFSETYARVYAFGDDGVPFAWREQYFGPSFLTNPCAAAGADCDGDGYSVAEEYQYTTDPTDGDSAPEILLTVRVVPKLTFTTIPGRSYRIDRTTTLNPPDWQTIVESILATGTELHYVDAEAPDNSFYRIELIQD